MIGGQRAMLLWVGNKRMPLLARFLAACGKGLAGAQFITPCLRGLRSFCFFVCMALLCSATLRERPALATALAPRPDPPGH